MTLPILVINPNSTVQMTRGLWVLLASHPSSSRLTYWTAPSGPSSINNSADCTLSTDACLPHLLPLLSHFSGFLVACYSDHPLVQRIKELTSKPVIGIFEASLCASLLLAKEGERFGIVSTGKVWEQLLSDGVSKFLGGSTAKFAGVETTGLSATDLHDADPEEVQTRMKDAVKRLVSRGNVTVVCLGCAGMAGMDTMVRAACVEELGEDLGLRVRIVDGVLFGVGMLEGLVQATAPAIL